MSLLALKSDQHRQLAYTDTLELTFCKRLLLKRTGRDSREPTGKGERSYDPYSYVAATKIRGSSLQPVKI